MKLVDTHCHIHAAVKNRHGDASVRAHWQKHDQPDVDVLIKDAQAAGVEELICVGTTVDDSQLAVEFVARRPACWAAIGIHPHEAKDHVDNPTKLRKLRNLVKAKRVVAVGECGLDYYYEHSPRAVQAPVLEHQMGLALEAKLPMIFHVREAFAEFWPVFDAHPGLTGVVHSFSATTQELDQILQRGLYVGLNDIMTFTKDPDQLAAARAIPLGSLVLETDAPFLTPVPFRGKINEPKQLRVIAEFLANLRGETVETLSQATTRNALKLFGI